MRTFEKNLEIDVKTRATLQARAALAGAVLSFLIDDQALALLATKNWSVKLQSLDHIEQFLQRLGAKR